MCIDVPGGFICMCPSGFNLAPDKKNCIGQSNYIYFRTTKYNLEYASILKRAGLFQISHCDDIFLNILRYK